MSFQELMAFLSLPTDLPSLILLIVQFMGMAFAMFLVTQGHRAEQGITILLGVGLGFGLGWSLGFLFTVNQQGLEIPILAGVIGGAIFGVASAPLHQAFTIFLGGLFTGLLGLILAGYPGFVGGLLITFVLLFMVGGAVGVYYLKEYYFIGALAFFGSMPAFAVGHLREFPLPTAAENFLDLIAWSQRSAAVFLDHQAAFWIMTALFLAFAYVLQVFLAVEVGADRRRVARMESFDQATGYCSLLVLLSVVFQAPYLFGFNVLTWPLISMLMGGFVILMMELQAKPDALLKRGVLRYLLLLVVGVVLVPQIGYLVGKLAEPGKWTYLEEFATLWGSGNYFLFVLKLFGIAVLFPGLFFLASRSPWVEDAKIARPRPPAAKQ